MITDVCDNSGRWKCPNEKKCINHDLVCDTLADCDDGADETEEACNEACQLRGEIACIQNGNVFTMFSYFLVIFAKMTFFVVDDN